MIQRNFILTDIMNTRNPTEFLNYIKLSNLPNQIFDLADNYYTLHNYDLEKYQRKFAIIDKRLDNKFRGNTQFQKDFEDRVQFLKNNNFSFISATPWESKINVDKINSHPNNYYPIFKLESLGWYGNTSYFWYYMHQKHHKKVFKIDHSKKNYDFLYLNKNPRPHRLKLFNYLNEKNIIENSLVSFVEHPIRPFDLDKKFELPFLDNTQSYPKRGMDQDLYELPYNQSICSIISESNTNNDSIFITEKLWKPIMMKQLFVVHGNLKYLEKIKSMGFKTFSPFIDESYDIELDQNIRIEKLSSTIEKIKNMNWQELYKQTEEIREHNYKIFWNVNFLAQEINKELSNWLKFFDSSQISS